MQTSKYLLASERDAQWGLTISTIGYEVIEPHDSYPTKGHADGYYFDINKGRTLDEFQLLYLTEGRRCIPFSPLPVNCHQSWRHLPVVPLANGIPTTLHKEKDGKAIG